MIALYGYEGDLCLERLILALFFFAVDGQRSGP